MTKSSRIALFTILFAASASLAQAATSLPTLGSIDAVRTGACTLAAFTTSEEPKDETGSDGGWTSCVQVTASMQSAPAVGQTADLFVSIKADQGTSGAAKVRLELPEGVSLVSAPNGFQSSTPKSTETNGTVATRVGGSASLSSNEIKRLTFQVKPTTAGAGVLRVIATDPSKRSSGGQDSVALTYSANTQTSHFGIDLPAVGALKTLPTGTRPSGFKAALATRAATNPDQGQTNNLVGRRAKSAATTCATGSFNYQDASGAWHPSPNIWVRAYDENFGLDTKLASGLTAADGSYRLCFNNAENSIVEASTADVYITFTAEVNQWKVVKSNGGTYSWQTGTTNNIGSGDRSFGSLTTGDSNTMRSLALYDTINRAFWSIPTCWDSRNTCEQKVGKWWPDYDVWPYASKNTFNMPGPGPDSPVVALHELGHTIMYDAYEHNWPASTCPNPHYVNRNEDQGCAWSEGWPNWFAGHVLQNEQLGWWSAPDDNNLAGSAPANTKLEDDSYGNPSPSFLGSTVEARVASALWDIEDSASDQYWDRTSEGYSKLWDTFQRHNDTDNFREFWQQRASDGYDTTSTSVLATLYQNTIDLYGGFRDDMLAGTTYTRPWPHDYGAASNAQDASRDHNWQTSRPAHNCKTITATPSGGMGVKLSVYTNSGLSNLLVESPGGTAAQTVTLTATGTSGTTVYPKVKYWGGPSANTYTVKAATCSILPTKFPVTLSAASLATFSYELAPVAGKTQVITVTPKSRGNVKGTADVKLEVQQLTPVVGQQSESWTSSTVATADAGGSGRPETLRLGDIQQGAKYVLVITTKAGNGGYSFSIS